MIKKRLTLSGGLASELSPEDVDVINSFIENESIRLLVAYNDQYNGLSVSHCVPSFPVQQLCYFIKSVNTTEVTSHNFLKEIQYGSVKSGHIESLLRIMMGIYAPIFFENRSWPDSILCTPS